MGNCFYCHCFPMEKTNPLRYTQAYKQFSKWSRIGFRDDCGLCNSWAHYWGAEFNRGRIKICDINFIFFRGTFTCCLSPYDVCNDHSRNGTANNSCLSYYCCGCGSGLNTDGSFSNRSAYVCFLFCMSFSFHATSCTGGICGSWNSRCEANASCDDSG